MVSRFLWSAVVLVVVLVHDVQGQQPDTLRTVTLEGVTVEAERLDESALRLRPARARPGLDLAGMLSGIGGIDIRQYGANGSAHLSLRGLPAEHTEILLDGIPLTHPQTGQVDLSLLPMVGVRSATVTGGTGGTGGGLGGSLLMDAGPEESGVTAHAVAGAWGERRFAMEASGEGLGGSGMLAWHGLSAPGSFPYKDPYAFSDADRKREGAWRASQSLMAKFSHGDRVRTNVLAWWSDSQRGLPGPVNSPPGQAWQASTMRRVQVSVDAGSGLGTDASLGKLRFRAEAAWTGHELAWRDATPLSATRSDLRATTGFVRLKTSWLRESKRVRLVVTPTVLAEHNRVRQTGAPDSDPLSERGEWKAEWGLAAARTTGSSQLDGFLTLLYAPGTESGLNPEDQRHLRGGASFSRDLGADVRLRAAAGRSVRLPTFTDRFWVPGGNPDLRPERGWTAEMGMDVRGVSLTVFRTDLRDRIIWRPMLAGVRSGVGTSVVQVYTPENVGRVVSKGVELRIGGQWSTAQLRPNSLAGTRSGFHLTWSLHGTVVLAVDRSHPLAPSYNHQLRYTPTRLGGGNVTAEYGGWLLELAVRHTGQRFITADETRWLSPQSSMDVSLGRTFRLPRARMFTWVNLNNAFDAHLEGMRLYPMPPRHFQGGITLTTRP